MVAGTAYIEGDIIPYRQLENAQAELFCQIKKVEIVVRPAAGKQVTVSSVFHLSSMKDQRSAEAGGKKVAQGSTRCKAG
jgi:hypothetical protein